MGIYDNILLSRNKGHKLFALLIDPDKCNATCLGHLIDMCQDHTPDIILVGGSIVSGDTASTVRTIHSKCSIPVVLFPGNSSQFVPEADGMLFLSLISGRNPDYLIGQQVNSAISIRKAGVETIPTGYMLIESGCMTSVEYISNTKPIPRAKTDIAVATAVAGEMLGLKMLYLEGGSGAQDHVPTEMISAVRQHVDIPLIVGGGLRTAEDVREVCNAGADIIVVGTAIEKNPQVLASIAQAVREYQ